MHWMSTGYCVRWHEKLWRVLWKDDLASQLRSVTGQMTDVQTDSHQISTRLEQLRKVMLEVEEGSVPANSDELSLISMFDQLRLFYPSCKLRPLGIGDKQLDVKKVCSLLTMSTSWLD